MESFNKKACLLIRVSTEQQDLIQQREKVIDAAKRDGFAENDLIVIEDKESAVKLSEEERNGLNKLKDHILNDSSITTVYAYEISRISRQAKIVYSIRDFLIAHHIQMIILNPYFKMLKDDGTLSETSNIFFGIFASLSENEGYIRNARMKRGKEKKKALGLHFTGRIPFGYKTDKEKRFIIDPEKGPLVKKIFTMYTDGDMSIRKIAKELRSQGYFKDNTPHTAERIVVEILHRRYYTGDVKGYPAIISSDMYERTQEIKSRRTIDNPRTPVKALLKGVMYNKDNDHMLTVNITLGHYYCKNGGGVSVSRAIIEPLIWDYAVSLHREFYSKDYEQAIAESVRMIQLATRKQVTYYQQMFEYRQQIERLEERVVLGKISSAKADELEKKIDENMKIAKKNYDAVSDDLERYRKQESQILDESNKEFDYDLFSLDEKMDLIKKVIKKIYVYRDETKKLYIEIYNNYNDDVKNIKLIRKYRNWIVG